MIFPIIALNSVHNKFRDDLVDEVRVELTEKLILLEVGSILCTN